MPFFTEKFRSPLSRKNYKSTPSRKDDSLQETPTIKLNLDGIQSEFQNGQWITDKKSLASSTASGRDELQDVITNLKEEINLLKLKNEILLDMLAEGAALYESQM